MKQVKNLTAVISILFLIFSCSGEKGGGESEKKPVSGKSAEQEVLSSSSEMINFGVYFDPEGKKRTITLEKGQSEFKAYVYIKFPVGMEVCAGQWKLLLPDGLELVNHKSTQEVNLSLGNLLHAGIAERYVDPLTGGGALIHTLDLKATAGLDDARIQIVAGGPDTFLGIATCEPDFPKKEASSFVGVVNPTD
ncbi:MAG: hypothetical protein GF417_08030 [Candidatus Latescibacteria bacterium]|nr:hypothetical protein [Candidatus Latescibacterota bacterium]